jgi:hypothetical protein
MLSRELKFPATSCEESPIAKKIFICIRVLTPPQAAGNALAVQFKKSIQLIPRPLSFFADLSFPGTSCPLSQHGDSHIPCGLSCLLFNQASENGHVRSS